MEKLRTVDVSHDVVDIFLINDNLGITALDEFLAQILQWCLHLHCLYLGSRNHTVANLGIWEIQGILENLHLIVNFVIIGSIVDARLYQIIQIHLRESFISLFTLHLHTYQTEQTLAQESTELADRPQDDVAQIGYRTEDGQQSVRVRFEQRLRQELAGEQHDERRQDGIGSHPTPIIQPCKKGIVKQTGKEDTIYYEGDVIAHQHGTHESVRMIIKPRQESLAKSVLLLIHLRQHTVRGNEGYLHSAEESREHHRDEDADNQTYINFFHDN